MPRRVSEPSASVSHSQPLSTNKSEHSPDETSKSPQPDLGKRITHSKFNIVVYGIKECPKGTQFAQRQNSDTTNVANLLKTLCPSISDQSIRDTNRLGKFREMGTRPILVTLSRACDASMILANSRNLPSNSQIRVKQQMSQEQRTIENLLLIERRKLIVSDVERKNIRMQNNRLYLNSCEHGRVESNKFIHNSPQPSTAQSLSNPVLSVPSSSADLGPTSVPTTPSNHNS